MRTLVLCVDRDDDIGVKTGIKGPLIGREENLAAAMKLGLADPEDADVNTVLAAIAIYDEQIKAGKEAEVATITGDVRVGTISDGVLTSQLEQVIEETRPSGAFLVSDGAEDEYIYPMIASRLRIDHVRRVFIRQSPALESTYYMLAKAMKNKKIQRRIMFPIGFALMIFSALYIFSPLVASSFVAFTIGLYLVFITLGIPGTPRDWARRTSERYEVFKEDLASGDISIVFTVMAAIIALVAVLTGLDKARTGANLGQQFVLFAVGSLWLLVLALLTFEGGRVATAFSRKGKVPKHVLVVACAFIAMGLIFFATLEFLSAMLGSGELRQSLWLLYIVMGLSIFIGIAGFISYRTRDENKPIEDTWRH